MNIVVTSVLVDDQEKALRFFTQVLGFIKKADIPMGQFRWLTVVSPNDVNGVELLLEPDQHPAAGPFKRRWSRTAFHSRRSASMTCRPSLTDSPPGSALHSAARGDGAGDDGGFRRHVRQSHPDRTEALKE